MFLGSSFLQMMPLPFRGFSGAGEIPLQSWLCKGGLYRAGTTIFLALGSWVISHLGKLMHRRQGSLSPFAIFFSPPPCLSFVVSKCKERQQHHLIHQFSNISGCCTGKPSILGIDSPCFSALGLPLTNWEPGEGALVAQQSGPGGRPWSWWPYHVSPGASSHSRCSCDMGES